MIKILKFSLLLFVFIEVSATPIIYQSIAQQHGISGELLYQTIYQKTSFLNNNKQSIPWPWTIYVNGQKFQFKDKIEMFNYLIKHQAKDGYEIVFGFANQSLEVQSRPLLWQQLDIYYMLNTAAEQLAVKTLGYHKVRNTSDHSSHLAGLDSIPSYVTIDNSYLYGFNLQWDKLIRQVSQETGVDALLLHAMISQESGGKKDATSHKGAMGLMQLMPNTANALGLSPQQYYDPYHNLKGGAKYIRSQIENFGDLSLALAAYNAGPNAVIKYGNKIPPYPETQHYVRVIKQRYAYLKTQQRQLR